MSGFQIPGLGFAKPNEQLPPLSPETASQAPPPNAEPTSDATPATAQASQPKAPEAPSTNPVANAPASDDLDITDAPAPAVTTLETTPAQAQDTNPSTSVQSEPVATSTSQDVESENKLVPEKAPEQPSNDPASDAMMLDRPASPPSLTSALEAALGGLDADNAEEILGQLQVRPEEPTGPDQPAQAPEWEADSSPYESSSESSTSSDDSDDDSNHEEYELLGIEETARLLMQAEEGSDDEGGDRSGKASGAAHLRTKNEMPDEIIPKPDVTITPEMKVVELGVIEHIVENVALLKANNTGEFQVLDTGSVLCNEERVVIGAIAETIGKVLQPMYTVHFNSNEETKELKLEVGSKIFYPADHAKFIFTEPLKAMKGSDASNLFDEEVGDDEMEFSDDEKEAEYKRATKQKRKGKGNAGGRDGHPLRQEVGAEAVELNYDDDDGPYKPLARPAGFGSGPVSQEAEPSRYSGNRGRGRGDSRGRGQRGRGANRGGGRGGRGGGYSLPAGGAASAPAPAPTQNFQPPPPPGWNPHGGAPPATPSFPFQWPPQPQGNAPPSQNFQPPPPPGWPGSNAQAPNPAFMNPALLASLLGQMHGQNGQQQQQPPSWGGQGQ